jgi:hypothetical protein
MTGACAVAARVLLQPRLDAGFVAVFVASFAFAMWLASPAFLPVTNGPDVVHHLQLIHAIARTWRLPHGGELYPYLLEMMGYTPGAHILAAAAGKLLETDPLRIVYAMAAAFFAVKAATIYALARRLIGSAAGSIGALAAPILALGAPVYFLGSFVQFFFFSQVVSEAFAMGMLLALVRWLQLGERRDLVAIAMCGIGVVLSWPVWIVPAGLTVALALLLAPAPISRRLSLVAATLAPAAVFAVVHQLTHRGATAIVTSAGAVTSPSIAGFGPVLVVLCAAGVALTVRDRGARAVVLFLAAIFLVAGGLALLAVRAGSTSFYMPFKMMYLAVPPAAVLGAVALARVVAMVPMAPRARLVAPAAPFALALLLAGGRIPLHRVHGSLSFDAQEVGAWARGHVPAGCIDYFSRYWLTGYWLHLDVLENPRLSDRMRVETFDFPDVAAKWIEGRGLPYAIVEDMTAIPREIRPDMEMVQQRGTFVLVRNRHPAACP